MGMDNETHIISTSWRILFDSTDHFYLVCPHCNHIVPIIKVETNKMKSECKRVTRIYAVCNDCQVTGIRKIYWDIGGMALLEGCPMGIRLDIPMASAPYEKAMQNCELNGGNNGNKT
jgi:hypothetical protein